MGSIDISQIKEHWEKYWVNNFSTKVKKMIKNNSVDINNMYELGTLCRRIS